MRTIGLWRCFGLSPIRNGFAALGFAHTQLACLAMGFAHTPALLILYPSWSADRRGKRSGFYIANCGKRPRKIHLFQE